MAELGALSLRIETVGDKQALAALDAIDTKAKKADISIEQATQALNKLGIAAKQVGGNIVVADAQLDQATRIVQRLGSQAKVTAGELAGLGSTTRTAATGASQNVQVFGQAVQQSSTRVTAFGRSGLNAFNALAFGASQMAASGTASFRSLATSMASVLSFFGTGGAIAAAVTATGLVLVDFFTRQKKEVTELAALTEKLRKDATARRERDQPVTVAQEELAGAKRATAAIDAQISAQIRLLQLGEVSQKEAVNKEAIERRLSALAAQKLDALNNENQALRRVNDAIAESAHELKGVTVTAESDAKIRERRQQALAAEISALESLSKSRGLTAIELLRLIQLEGALNKELASGTATKEREAAIWEQIAKGRAAAARAIPAATVQPITPSRPIAPGQIAVPPSVAAFLDPSRTQADVQRADAEMAARVAAFNFHETTTALSESLANALGSAIATGFAQGLGEGGIAEGFKQMAAQLAQGLGSMAIDFGIKAILTSQMMATIAEALASLNPWVALAAGVALVALGQSFGGRKQGNTGFSSGRLGGGGSAGASESLSIRRLVVDPNAGARQRMASGLGSLQASAPSTVQVIEVIGASTPRGQELIGTSNQRYLARRS